MPMQDQGTKGCLEFAEKSDMPFAKLQHGEKGL